MKKVLFLICLLVFCSVKVNALSIYEIEVGDVYSYGQEVLYGYTSSMVNSFWMYVDKNGNLLEAYYTTDYEIDLEVTEEGIYIIGESCEDSFMCSNSEYNNGLIVSNNTAFSGKNIYWEVISITEPNIFSFCGLSTDKSTFKVEDNKYPGTFCDELYYSNDNGLHLYTYYNSIPFFVLQEYDPVAFELVCEPEEVKKGEIASCKLKAKAEDNVVEVTINPNSETYEVVDYKETEGWTSEKNEDGTITLKNEEGFKGEDFIVSVDLKFKEAILDDVVVELTDISYTTESGATLKSTVNDKVNIYEEPEEEIKEDVEKNPETVGFTPAGSLLILLLSLILLIVYRKRVSEGM